MIGSTGFTLDPASPKLFFTEETKKRISVVNRNGTNQQIILDNLEEKPRPIVVEPSSRYVSISTI